MGISNLAYPLLIDHLNKYEKAKKESVLLELGIQENVGNHNFHFLRDHLSPNYKNYISVDLHQHPAVTIFDLSNYEPNKFICDILTNFGTSEHVEYEEGQYNCWLNIHQWLSIGGISIHEIPKINNWRGHCRYYCSHDFFKSFEKIGYEILELKDITYSSNGDLVWCVMKKHSAIDFMDQKMFFDLMFVNKDIPLSQLASRNNPKNLT